MSSNAEVTSAAKALAGEAAALHEQLQGVRSRLQEALLFASALNSMVTELNSNMTETQQIDLREDVNQAHQALETSLGDLKTAASSLDDALRAVGSSGYGLANCGSPRK
ncbi:MAG TPA: hypothetical protein VFU07_05110 [Candidatus Lumbricidophila sp.]|nr:hypothetical protein [Candidatus Lumbricidophila sp.]